MLQLTDYIEPWTSGSTGDTVRDKASKAIAVAMHDACSYNGAGRLHVGTGVWYVNPLAPYIWAESERRGQIKDGKWASGIRNLRLTGDHWRSSVFALRSDGPEGDVIDFSQIMFFDAAIENLQFRSSKQANGNCLRFTNGRYHYRVVLRDVECRNAALDGLAISGGQAYRLDNFISQYNGRYGISFTDFAVASVMTGIDCEQNKAGGVYVYGDSYPRGHREKTLRLVGAYFERTGQQIILEGCTGVIADGLISSVKCQNRAWGNVVTTSHPGDAFTKLTCDDSQNNVVYSEYGVERRGNMAEFNYGKFVVEPQAKASDETELPIKLRKGSHYHHQWIGLKQGTNKITIHAAGTSLLTVHLQRTIDGELVYYDAATDTWSKDNRWKRLNFPLDSLPRRYTIDVVSEDDGAAVMPCSVLEWNDDWRADVAIKVEND